jgi:hypothetical protein
MGTCQTWETTTRCPTLITFDLGPRWHLLCSFGLQKPPDPGGALVIRGLWHCLAKQNSSEPSCHGPSPHGPGFTTRASASDAHQSRNEEPDRPGNPGDSSWMTSLGLVTHAHCRRRRKKETWHESSELNQWSGTLSTGLQCLFSLPFVL